MGNNNKNTKIKMNKFSLLRSKFTLIFSIIIMNNLIIGLLATDFYTLLNINRDASEKEIKKAFRKLSLKYHPDRNPGDDLAHQRYLEINKAYETLLNPEKRQIYDIYGEEGLDNEQHIQHHNRMPKGPNARLDLSVDLEELYNGNIKEMSITKNVTCKKCRGTGGKLGNTKKCNKCHGRGVVLEEVDTGMGFTMRMQNQCNKCGGKGIIFAETCEICRGRKVVKEDKKLRIEIEKGMPDGHNIVFPRESESHPDHSPGDLILTIKTNKHRFFDSRLGNNLYATIELNLKEALLGYSKDIMHLDNRSFNIQESKPTQPFWVKTVRNEGMPQYKYPSSKGDLHINLKVRLPQKLSEEEKKLVNELFD